MKWRDASIDCTDSMESFDTAPGRGHAGYRWYKLRKDGEESDTVTSFRGGLYCPMFDLSAFSAGNDMVREGYRSVLPDHAHLVGGEDTEIGRDALAAIETTFAAARSQGVQLIPRFGYTTRAVVGAEPRDFEWILRHIEQVSQVINKYKDTVIAVNCGLIGPWAEMHSSCYHGPEYTNRIVGKWLECLDEQIPLQTRTAGFILHYAEDNYADLDKKLPLTAEHPAYRLGMYNDGYLGTAWDYGTWVDTTMPRDYGIRLLDSQAAHVPYGGELAYADIKTLRGGEDGYGRSPIYESGFVDELYHTHLQYLHNIVNGPQTCKEMEGLTFDEYYAFEGMPDVSCYYGQTLRKFVHDHLGYRFVIRQAQSTGGADSDGTVFLRGKVENTGFGNVLSPLCAQLIVIAPDGSAFCVDCAVDLRQWKSRTVSEYSLSLPLPEGARAGEYRVHLRFGTLPYEEGAATSPAVRFANGGVWCEQLGANYIGSFTVK